MQDLGPDASHAVSTARIHRASPGPTSGTRPVLSTQAPAPNPHSRPPFLAPWASHHTMGTPPSDTGVSSLPLFTRPVPDLKCERLGAVTLPSPPVHPFPDLGLEPGLLAWQTLLDE